jgi:two-component system, NtrC family, response regulator
MSDRNTDSKRGPSFAQILLMATQQNIALIEDSPDSAQLFTVFLSNFCDDIKVFHFPNGSEFLKSFHAGLYRAALVDLSLPEMTGYDVLKTIRSIDPVVPVIAFTAHGNKDTHEKALQAGFNAYLTKPVHDLDAFCQTIVDLVKKP